MCRIPPRNLFGSGQLPENCAEEKSKPGFLKYCTNAQGRVSARIKLYFGEWGSSLSCKHIIMIDIRVLCPGTEQTSSPKRSSMSFLCTSCSCSGLSCSSSYNVKYHSVNNAQINERHDRTPPTSPWPRSMQGHVSALFIFCRLISIRPSSVVS